jgi:hypothetical protein
MRRSEAFPSCRIGIADYYSGMTPLIPKSLAHAWEERQYIRMQGTESL